MAKKIAISKENLEELYETEKFNTYEIAKKFKCCQATIWKRLIKLGIKRRTRYELNSNVPSKEELIKFYLKKKLSTWAIERKYGFSRGTVYRKLKEYGLVTRNRADSHILFPRNDFSGDLIEKAYLIGFRLGDLGVRKIWPNSKTISVASGSTIKEQIDLIKDMFEPYCKVWVKEAKNGKINVQASLNESFSFLLNKKIPFWAGLHKETFFAFLAGFTDAEGHVGIYNKMAQFGIGNSDLRILKFLKRGLEKWEIHARISSDNRAGSSTKEGYVYNQNYHTLRVSTKSDLLSLFFNLKPYLKHKLKIEALKKAEKNILERNRRLNMKKNKQTFYITTPIYYTNGSPHLGSAYTTIAADVLARWHKLLGEEVFFLTGTDEHGQKIQEAAEQNKQKPKEFVDKIVTEYKEAFKMLDIQESNFIRTTDRYHEEEVKELLNVLFKKKLIYKGFYESFYCVGCEQYLTKSDLIEGKCPLHNRTPELKKEEAYLFKLSAFQDKLLKAIKNEKFRILPEERRKEIVTFIESGLQDVSISRLKEKIYWGIELPFDKKHCAWVWPDALWNYVSGLRHTGKSNFDKFWPADVQLMAKDILRVHATIWPALLLGAGYELPKTLFVHGYFTIGGQKMSKSLGNVISPVYLTRRYGADSVRYYLMRNLSFGSDGDVSEQGLVKHHNGELADKLGNLVSRVSALAEKNGIEKTENNLLKKLKLFEIKDYLENYKLDKAINSVFAFVDLCNEYIQEKKPWENKCKDKEKILYELIDSIKAMAILLWPFIPSSSEKIAKHFGFKISFKEINKPYKVQKIKKSEILFQKVEFLEEKSAGKEKEGRGEGKAGERVGGVMNMNEIKFDDFAKLDLRVATIKKAEDIKDVDKLYKLTIDDGKNKNRVICAGIKEHYSKDELKNKQIVIVANLAPREMKGIKSEGMLLAAVSTDHKKVVLLSPEKKVEEGSKVQ